MRNHIGIAILSATALMLEITLTRLLSAMYFPQFVFIALSLAILGISLGAGASVWWSQLRDMSYLPYYASSASIATLLTVFGLVMIQIPPFNIAALGLMVIPFTFVGLFMSTLFSVQSDKSLTFYAADFLGAGVGVVAVIWVLNTVGTLSSFLLIAALFALIGLAFGGRTVAGGVLAVSLFGFALQLSGGWLSVGYNTNIADKPIHDVLIRGGQILDTRYDAFARTDLVAPANGGAYQIYVDGAAGSVIPPAGNRDFLRGDIGFFPFATGQPERAMIIGFGGGLDIWFAQQANTAQIDAVEVNPNTVAMLEDTAAYHGDLLNQEGVNVIVGEGRSTLRRQSEPYDLIYLSQVITETASRSGLALTENTIYTAEAFNDYLDHLTPNGQIALKLYDEPTLTRALSVAMAALNSRGLSDQEALQHILVLLDPNTNPPVPLLLIQNSPFTENDALALGAVTREVGFTPLFLPHVFAQPPLRDVAAGNMTYADVIANYDGDIRPTTDNRPYFFQFERGLPGSLQTVSVITVAVLGLVLVGWGIAQQQPRPILARLSPLYFMLLGIAFIGIEVAVIQSTGLFLGHPTMAISVTLATFLISGGVGSLLGSRWYASQADRIPAMPLIGILVAALVWLGLWYGLHQRLLQSPLIGRIAFTMITLAPLGFFMGMPFPLGLRSVGHLDGGYVALGWSLNGLTSVMGSIFAVTLSVAFGFISVWVMGIVSYAIALLLAWSVTRMDGRHA